MTVELREKQQKLEETLKGQTSFDPAAVPEPSTYLLLTIALGAVGFVRRKLRSGDN